MSSGPVQITSPAQLSNLLSSSRVVVINFYSETNAASQAVGPVYDRLAIELSRPGKVTFTKVNVEQQAQIATSYSVTTTPTFKVFKNSRVITSVNGLNANNASTLSDAIQRLANEAEADDTATAAESSSASKTWLGAGLPRGYSDVTDQIDLRGLDLLNSDSEFGSVRTLFEASAPVSVGKGKGAASASTNKKDWVESDVDEQLMLYIPFSATVKVHTIQITSLPPKPSDDDDDEIPIRPKTIRLYTNRQHNLGFEEAEDIPATQTIELQPRDWDEKTGTAKLELRFVKFQNISSLVIFVVDGEGEGERTRIDRIRIVGEAGEKRDMGKLEKIGHDDD